MISVLNSVSNLVAENALTSTQASLQNTLTQLSTGLKINSGADDPAGLSIANGLGTNISALTQSSQNASNGIGLLANSGRCPIRRSTRCLARQSPLRRKPPTVD